MMDYAPVAMFVYNRADHFKEVFDALSRCPEATQTELFIFSDGAKNEGGEKKVEEVRQAVREKLASACFKKVECIESPVNKGLAASIIGGVSDILDKYGKVIVLEDDCVPSPHLLTFFNRALDFYENDKTVGSVAGFTPKMKFPEDYTADVFGSYRSCSWGWATWKRSWENVDWELKDFGKFCRNRRAVQRFDSGGTDRFARLYRQTKGNGTSWSVRFGMHLAQKKLMTVYPKYSYISNIGCDESGVHSKSEDAAEMSVDLSKAISDPKMSTVSIDKRVQKQMKKHYSAGLVSECKRFALRTIVLTKQRYFP